MASSIRDRAAASGDWHSRRPLSPHLQVYRFTITMSMSIVHRITGAALYFGMLIPALWLLALAVGPAWFQPVQELFGSWLGRLILIGYTWALMHHMLGGIRHLIWDMGYGLTLEAADALAWATLIGSIVLTAALWLGAYALGVL